MIETADTPQRGSGQNYTANEPDHRFDQFGRTRVATLYDLQGARIAEPAGRIGGGTGTRVRRLMSRIMRTLFGASTTPPSTDRTGANKKPPGVLQRLVGKRRPRRPQ